MPAPEVPVRCLIVMPLAEQRGGSELTLLHLIEHGRDKGVKWSVAFFEHGPMVDIVRGWGVPTHVVSAGRLRQPQRFAAAIWCLRQLVRRESADVVLSWMGKGQIYGGIAAALAGVPAAWFQHGLPDPPCWIDRLATRIPACVILTCSNATAAAQAKLKPRRPTVVVYPGVDLSRFDPDRLPTQVECRRKLGLPTAGPLVGIVGRLQRWKGIHHLVEAMPALLAKHPDFHAVIVGGPHAFEPHYPAWLDARIVSLGLTDRVIRAGLQYNVPEWMQAMDVVVHASKAEPFGLVVVEAMALGKPTVATATAGPTEIITDGVDGHLWQPGDVGSLTDALLRITADPELATTSAIAGRRRAAQFSVDRYADAVVTYVRQATGRELADRPTAQALPAPTSA